MEFLDAKWYSIFALDCGLASDGLYFLGSRVRGKAQEGGEL
jgi:hypothetical protein